MRGCRGGCGATEKVGGGDSGHSSGEESAWLNKQWEAPGSKLVQAHGHGLLGKFPRAWPRGPRAPSP